MKLFKKIFFLSLPFLLSSCALWPYKTDFDCPLSEGYRCKSLYDIAKMADQGMFDPNIQKYESDKTRLDCCNGKNK